MRSSVRVFLGAVALVALVGCGSVDTGEGEYRGTVERVDAETRTFYIDGIAFKVPGTGPMPVEVDDAVHVYYHYENGERIYGRAEETG